MKNKFVPKIPDKSVISIRLDNELIASLDELANNQKISRNELVSQCIVFALENLDERVKAT